MRERLLLQTPRATATIRCAGALLLALASAGCAGSTTPSGDGQLADGVAPFDSDTSSDGDTRFDGAGDGAVTEGGSLDAGADAAPGCEAGALRCGAECVSAAQTQTDPLRCGASCAVCPAGPASSHPVCAAGACDFECDAGFMRLGARCERARVVLLAPHSGYRQTSARPGFRFRLPPRTTRATVEVCADRACATVEQSADVSARSEWTPPAVLSRGRHFWRVRATTDAGELVPAALPFYTPRFERPVNAESLLLFDFDGDGRTDFLERYNNERQVRLALSGSDPFAITTRSIEVQPASIPSGCTVSEVFRALPAGDLNSDGYGDIVLQVALSCTTAPNLFLGIAMGGPTVPGPIIATIETTMSARFRGPLPDFDDDGLGDLLLEDYNGGPAHTVVSFNELGRSSRRTSLTIGADTTVSIFTFIAGDLNADGYFDLIQTRGNSPSFCGEASPLFATIQYFPGRAFGFDSARDITLLEPSNLASTSPAGDLNGDGFPDFVARAEPRNLVLLGGRTSTTVARYDRSDRPRYRSRENVVSLGDVDDDGYDDWALGGVFTTYVPHTRAQRWLDVYRGGVVPAGVPSTTISLFDDIWDYPNIYVGVYGIPSMDLDGDGVFDILLSGDQQSLMFGFGARSAIPASLSTYPVLTPPTSELVFFDSTSSCGIL